MKRLNSHNPNGNPSLTPGNPNLPDFNRTSQRTPAKKTFKPYLPADVRQRIGMLGPAIRNRTEQTPLAIGIPKLYVPEEERTHFFNFPDDIFSEILPQLNQKAMLSLAASSRFGYFQVDRHAPMRRLPGLLADLRRLRVGTLSIDPDSFKAFLEAITAVGDYDRALLTPLAPALRCAVTFAMDAWANSRLLERNRIKSHTLVTEFLKHNYDPAFENGLEQILQWHLKYDDNRISTVAFAWASFFASPHVSLEIRSRTFETLVGFLFEPKTKIFHPEKLADVAIKNSLHLNFLTIGLLALLDTSTNFFVERIDKRLAELKDVDPAAEILLVLSATSNYTRPCLQATEIIRHYAILSKMLDAAAKSADGNTETLLLELISIFERTIADMIGGSGPLDREFSYHFPFNQILQYMSAEESASFAAIAAFARSLADKIFKLQGAKVGKSSLARFSTVMQALRHVSPEFDDYIGIVRRPWEN